MGRGPSCGKGGVKVHKGAWTALEDKKLVDYVTAHGDRKWSTVAREAGLKRCAKSCRLRWLNYLRPDIKRGNITDDEEDLIIRLHKLLGNRWSLIAGRLPGRTDNEIKNYWNTHIIKKEKARQSGNVTVEDPKHGIFNRAETVKPLGPLQQVNTRLDPSSAEVSSSDDPDFELVESRSGINVSPTVSLVETGLGEFKMDFDDLDDDDDVDLSGMELDFDFSRLVGDGLLGQSLPWLPHGFLGTWSSEFASGEDWII